MERFSDVPIKPKISHFRPFGCPIYVLQGKLQAGQRGPKWDKQVRIGLYLTSMQGQSHWYSANVTNRLASPQFHCKFDNLFETTDHIDKVIKWQREAYFSTSDLTSDQVLQPSRKPSVRFRSPDITMLPPSTAPPSMTTAPEVQPDETPANEGELAAITHQETAQQQNSAIPEASEPLNPSPPISSEEPPPFIRQSTRSRQSPQCLIAQPAYASQFWDLWEIGDYEVQEEMQNPITFAASADPDTMITSHEAMQQPDRAKFLEAMEAEVESHQSKGHWKVRHRDEIPPGMKILPAACVAG